MQTPMIAFKPHYEHQKVDVNANECVRAPRNARHDWLLKLTNGVYLKFTIHNMWTNPIVGVYSPKKLACAIHTFLSVSSSFESTNRTTTKKKVTGGFWILPRKWMWTEKKTFRLPFFPLGIISLWLYQCRWWCECDDDDDD